jgi:uncharacterized Zn-binding protein involved in type VI secretion
MNEINTFIQQAREKKLDDATIRKSLEAEGWDTASINLALSGLEVPKPTTPAMTPNATTGHPSHPTLSPLMAAIHHVILWFFTGSSTVAIGGTVAAIYGMNVSATALASMIAVTLITFIPYAILFGIYLAKKRKTPDLVPGKVWSIITICLHSIGAMVSAIVIVINLVTAGEAVFLVSAALAFLLNMIIVTTYSLAAFGLGKTASLRKAVTILHLPLLVVMFGILFSLSLVKLGPVQHDEALRKDLTNLINKIAADTKAKEKLPDSIENLTSNKTITYQKTSRKTYKVCAPFQTSSWQGYETYYGRETTDAYSSEEQFYTKDSGEQCFEFTSDYLNRQQETNGATILGL